MVRSQSTQLSPQLVVIVQPPPKAATHVALTAGVGGEFVPPLRFIVPAAGRPAAPVVKSVKIWSTAASDRALICARKSMHVAAIVLAV